MRKLLLLALAGPLLAAGCRYTAAGGLPPEVRTIGVTMLRNNTRCAGLESEVTSAVISALQSNGRLRVVEARANPDLVLAGSIDGYRLRSVRTDIFGDPVRLEVEVTAVVTVRKADGQHLFRNVAVSNRATDLESGSVDLTRGENESLGRSAAVAELGRNIARRIVEQGW
jgi:hypothetical protein